MFKLRWQIVFSPRMHQERGRSKASETRSTNIRDKKRLSANTFCTSKCHHLIILIPLRLAVQVSVETVTHNTTITPQTRTLEHIRPRQPWEEI